MRPRRLLLTCLFPLLALLLAGCGDPAAAPAPPTATSIPATSTPVPVPTAPPTDTVPPQPTNSPTPVPTATPVPLAVVTRTVAFPDDTGSNNQSTIASAAHGRVATLGEGVVRLIDPTSGRVQGPITVTTDTEAASNARLLADDAHARVDVLIDGPGFVSTITPTLTQIDLGSGHVLSQHTLSKLPAASVHAATVISPTGDLLVELEQVSGYPTSTPPRLFHLASDGSLRRVRSLDDVGALTLDAPAGLVFLSVTGDQTATITADDIGTLTPRWILALPYQPAATVIDPGRGRLWLLAPGGRTTIVDVRNGRTVATCDPSYSKPALWEPTNDLVVDPRTGLGYTSWRGGADYSSEQTAIDVIDPARHTRTTLTNDGGALAVATTTTDRLLGLDAAGNLVLRDARTGHLLGLATSATTLTGATSLTYNDFGSLTIDQAGPSILVTHAMGVPYQNNVTGATSAPGVV